VKKLLTIILGLTALIFQPYSAHAGWWDNLDKIKEGLVSVNLNTPLAKNNKLIISAIACPAWSVSDAVLERDAKKKIAGAFSVERTSAKYMDANFGESVITTSKVQKDCLRVTSTRIITEKTKPDKRLVKIAKQFSSPTLKVCYRNIPGLSYSRRGDPQGPSITFATMIASEIGKPVKFVRIASGSDRQKRIGQWCHLAMSTFTWTDERAKWAADNKHALSDFYYTGGLVAKGINPEFTEIDAMSEYDGRIVVIKTTTGAKFAKDNFPQAEIVVVRRLAQVQGKMIALAKKDPNKPVITVHDEMLLAGFDGYTPIMVEGMELLTEADNYVVIIDKDVAFLKPLIDDVITTQSVQDLYFEAAGR